MRAKKVTETLNEWSKGETPEFKLNQYEKWRKWHEEVDPNMESSYHNRYRVVDSIEKNGYYDLLLTSRWSRNAVKTFILSLNHAGINVTFKNNYIRIHNPKRDPDITETIVDYIENEDPIGEIYGTDYFKPKIGDN